jgi:hypothetical protein
VYIASAFAFRASGLATITIMYAVSVDCTMTELLSTGESVCRLDRRKLVIRNVRLQRPQMEETARKGRRNFLRTVKIASWQRGEIVDINASMARSWARQMSGDIKWSICIYVYFKFMQYCNVSCAVHRPPYVCRMSYIVCRSRSAQALSVTVDHDHCQCTCARMEAQ